MRALCLSALILVACSSSSGPKPGHERGQCYPNQTCDAGLQCLSGLCVADPSEDATLRDGGGGEDVPTISLDGYEVATVIPDGSEVAVERVACEFCQYKPGECDDKDPCTEDECDQAACRHWRLPAGQCQCAKDADCDDGNACTKDACANGRCTHRNWSKANGEPLPEGCCYGGAEQGECPSTDDCNIGDCCGPNDFGCAIGTCRVVADCCLYDDDCDDGYARSVDHCNKGHCLHAASTACSSDGDCAEHEVCENATCEAGTRTACPEATACRPSGFCEPCDGPCHSE